MTAKAYPGVAFAAEGRRGVLLISSTQTTVTTGTTSLATYVKITLDGTPVIDTDDAADTVNSKVVVPSWVNFVRVTGHISFPDQNVAAGHASAHLWRNVRGDQYLTPAGTRYYVASTNADKPTPEAHYHNRIYYPQLATSSYISLLAVTPIIPVLAVNEEWTLYGWQDTGASVITSSGAECWLGVEFFP